jgi:putative solute:sodium symporter small subunit
MRPAPFLTPLQKRARYWKYVRRLTLLLLLLWWAVTFGVIFFARELSGFAVFGWPFSFYMAAQGTVLIYVALVGFYAWRMGKLEKILKDDGTHGQ